MVTRPRAATEINDKIVNNYFIIQLQMPLVLTSWPDAMKTIEILKNSKNSNYYKGAFSNIIGNCFIYEFETTLPASQAKLSDFPINITECDVNVIAPACEMTHSWDIDICYVSETKMDKAMAVMKTLGAVEMRDVLLRDLDKSLHKPISKETEMVLKEFKI